MISQWVYQKNASMQFFSDSFEFIFNQKIKSSDDTHYKLHKH